MPHHEDYTDIWGCADKQVKQFLAISRQSRDLEA